MGLKWSGELKADSWHTGYCSKYTRARVTQIRSQVKESARLTRDEEQDYKHRVDPTVRPVRKKGGVPGPPGV